MFANRFRSDWLVPSTQPRWRAIIVEIMWFKEIWLFSAWSAAAL